MSMTRRRRPARKCLEAIEGHNGASLVQAAVRLLASRNPAGADRGAAELPAVRRR